MHDSNALLALALGVATALWSLPAAAEDVCNHEDHFHSHVGHVMTCWDDTPENHGFLIVAQMEAATALEHTQLALAHADDLAAVQMHMRHVINALEPSIISEGPGLGYGLIHAAEGAGVHASFALQAESTFATGGTTGDDNGYEATDGDAVDSALDQMFDETEVHHMSESVIVQAEAATQFINNALQAARDALTSAQSSLERTDLALAVEDAQAVLAALTIVNEGQDLNGDGVIETDAGEGGLTQAHAAMLAIIAEEGLEAPHQH